MMGGRRRRGGRGRDSLFEEQLQLELEVGVP